MPGVHQVTLIPVDDVHLEADVTVPGRAHGVVVFAHGSGSGRHSTRNRRVAEMLQRASLATVLVDLLTVEEGVRDARTGELRFDIELLARRVIGVTEWTVEHDATRGLGVGLFGASTGAAAALVAAARRHNAVQAVVSRGGRPDLADVVLPQVRQPVLLIVGGRDDVVLELNRRAFTQLGGEARLEIVAGATHLFEERGALDRVTELTSEWFARYLHVVPRSD